MFEPLNTEWNRKTGILPGKGNADLLGIKHGIAYFSWTTLDNSVTFLKCEEGVLKKHFRLHNNISELLLQESQDKLDTLLTKKTKFLKYPFEVV